MKEICNKSMSFNECELAILRSSVDKAEMNKGKVAVNSPEIKQIIDIVEKFIKRKGLICYGGTAINNILPKQDQFYNRDFEMPDYDFFSENALDDAKELADEYEKAGFVEAEAKSGQHYGTFKVFVNFIPVADITSMPEELFDSLKKESIVVAGIHYAPPNYLRMLMYLELSRPAGDVGRWEKVLKRLTLLNKNYPLTSNECSYKDFQRKMSNKDNGDLIYDTVKQTLVHQGVVFFGGYAISLYSRYMPSHLRKKLEKIPDFDVLSTEPEKTAEIVKEKMMEKKIKGVKIVRRPALGELLSVHYEIKVGDDTVLIIYKPMACHSYNVVKHDGFIIKIATIDTMLSFYLAFLYANREYLANKDRILCMSHYLFEVQEKNRLAQKGLLKRFSINCIGHQETVEEIRAEKSQKFRELRSKRGSREFNEWFLRYRPSDLANRKKMTKEEKEAIYEKELKQIEKDLKEEGKIQKNTATGEKKNTVTSVKKNSKKNINRVKKGKKTTAKTTTGKLTKSKKKKTEKKRS
jgi:hypothetical protein